MARAEMWRIASRYDRQCDELGDRCLSEVGIALRLLRQFPNGFTQVGSRHRRIRLNRFPYFLVYEPTQVELKIVGVAHFKRRPKFWTSRTMP